ncbi:hypothetical protein PPERSA_01221 [Pseudocohnilembus persalinus]|uniref:MORN motif n=1 Tax=Pseudocohnilembus persalinus TaxID=266149 RepID=A0A0V0R968_PSEPJ|nr:hypothetical protein PPERSA_01221 [Pseudocohnilembus persalinus]|eukprot:KRX11022.1 hypothetical protein PPERSA_01221 [Pseudocohnilembus persalinus]
MVDAAKSGKWIQQLKFDTQIQKIYDGTIAIQTSCQHDQSNFGCELGGIFTQDLIKIISKEDKKGLIMQNIQNQQNPVFYCQKGTKYVCENFGLPIYYNSITDMYHVKDDLNYIGEKYNNKRHGRGHALYEDGSKYDGYWQDGQKHGQGICIYNNGDIYQGEWQFDKREGQGTYNYINGDTYEGQWKNDLKDGNGTYTFRSGAKYDGDWVKGQLHNKGVYYYSDGKMYDGEWRNNQKEGRGVKIYYNGEQYRQNWNEGQLKSDKKLTLKILDINN